jgi:hypothetical protein
VYVRVVLLLLAAALLGCTASPPQTTSEGTLTPRSSATSDVTDEFEARYRAASAAVTLFHVRFDQRNFGRIYAAADDTFRATTTEEVFTSRIAAQRDRVGMTQSQDELSVDIGARGQDLLITIVVETIFQSATLVETFVWRVTPSQDVFLVSYVTR